MAYSAFVETGMRFPVAEFACQAAPIGNLVAADEIAREEKLGGVLKSYRWAAWSSTANLRITSRSNHSSGACRFLALSISDLW